MQDFAVSQIDHIELFVPDRREAARWYEETFGLRILPEFEDWADNPRGPLMIGTLEGSTKLALFTGRSQGERPTAGFHQVAFRVDRPSFEAFLHHIQLFPVFDDKGDPLHELTVRDHGLALSVYFHDPYGHRLEITTYEVDHPDYPDRQVAGAQFARR